MPLVREYQPVLFHRDNSIRVVFFRLIWRPVVMRRDETVHLYLVRPIAKKSIQRLTEKLQQSQADIRNFTRSNQDEEQHVIVRRYRSEKASRCARVKSDLEHGLECRSGSFLGDDLVLTEYYRTACRICDTVIVNKAGSDGATPKDVIHTALKQGGPFSHFITRMGNCPCKTTVPPLDRVTCKDFKCLPLVIVKVCCCNTLSSPIC
jgi:hypothetical protein